MLSAMQASTGGAGIWTTPKVASESVIEWATVKPVTVNRSILILLTMRISPSTNRRWSKPNKMCSMPCDR